MQESQVLFRVTLPVTGAAPADGSSPERSVARTVVQAMPSASIQSAMIHVLNRQQLRSVVFVIPFLSYFVTFLLRCFNFWLIYFVYSVQFHSV
jgi:hypothetical protein